MASYYIENSLKFLFFVLLTLMLSFPKSFAVIKIVILAFMFSMVFLHIVLGGVRRFSLDIIFFYLVFILLAVIWLIVGLLNDGYAIALGDAFRLYVVFSLIFLVLYLWLENFDYLPLIFSSIMVSTIIIFAFCFLSIFEALYSVSLFPDFLRVELNVMAGGHEGHFQLGNNSVNSLFFTVPFLLSALVCSSELSKRYRFLFFVSLVLGVIAVLLAGRRALMLILLMVPFLAVFFRRISGVSSIEGGRGVGKIIFVFTFFAVCVGGVILLAGLNVNQAAERIESAFAGDSVRVDQFISLWKGFTDSPLLGSGFGGSVDVIRSEERPWMYELSYMQLLFNGGLLGFSLITGCIGFFYLKALFVIKNFSLYRAEAISTLVGVLVFCVGSATNPYFSGFDSLFLLGFIPLIASVGKVYAHS